MEPFTDGEPMVIVYRSGSGKLAERRVEYCDPPIVIGDTGATYLHFYIYEPDGCTDLMPLDRVVELRRGTVVP